MPYVRRKNGVICGLFNVEQAPQEGFTDEFLAADHADVVAYLNPPAPTANDLEQFCKDAFNGTGRRVDDFKLIVSVATYFEAKRLNKTPAQLTGGEKAALRDAVAAIYKTL